jgi:hypothetical protein
MSAVLHSDVKWVVDKASCTVACSILLRGNSDALFTKWKMTDNWYAPRYCLLVTDSDLQTYPIETGYNDIGL